MPLRRPVWPQKGFFLKSYERSVLLVSGWGGGATAGWITIIFWYTVRHDHLSNCENLILTGLEILYLRGQSWEFSFVKRPCYIGTLSCAHSGFQSCLAALCSWGARSIPPPIECNRTIRREPFDDTTTKNRQHRSCMQAFYSGNGIGVTLQKALKYTTKEWFLGYTHFPSARWLDNPSKIRFD